MSKQAQLQAKAEETPDETASTQTNTTAQPVSETQSRPDESKASIMTGQTSTTVKDSTASLT